jgi:hypothetical protein
MSMSKGAGALFNGIVALVLSIILWRLTHSTLGWAVLFTPGAVLVLWGFYLVLVEGGR